MKNHYQILNIAELEQALISAGYSKAKSELLSKKSQFENEAAYNARLQDIEQAYHVLSNKALKREHDKALLEAEISHSASSSQWPSAETPIGDHHTPSPAQLRLEQDWQLASEHFPLILQEYDRLSKFDQQLAKTYQTQLHAKGNYKDSTAFKDQLEKKHFSSIYGNNTPAKAYAKKLLLSNWRAAAEKFNASLGLLGHVVSISDLVMQIEKEFEFVKNTHEHTEFFSNFKKDKCNTKSCIAFLEEFFQVKIQRQRFLFDQTFSFHLDDEDIFLHHTDELKGFIKTHFFNYKKRDVPDNPFIMGR